MKLVHGKPCHPESQGSVESAYGDINGIIVAWVANIKSQDWTTGIKFIQFPQINYVHHSGIMCSPYSAMSGSEVRIRLTTSSLPNGVISTINNEADLLAVFPNNMPTCHDRYNVRDESTDIIHTENTDIIHTRNTVREAVVRQSSSGGQGFVKCNCSGTKECTTNRCKCLKSKLQCNSHYHNHLNCTNK